MPKYYVNDNAQSNGDHEVHKEGCSYLPDVVNRTYLGEFQTCQPAVREAKKNIRNQTAVISVQMRATRPNTLQP